MQRHTAARELVLRDPRALFLDLGDVGEDLGEGPEFPLQLRHLIKALRIGGALHRLLDGVLEAGFGCQRRLAIVFFSGRYIILRQRPVRDQFAIDIARQIGLRDAVAIGRHAGRDAFKSKVSEAHAGGRNGQHDGKTKHDF